MGHDHDHATGRAADRARLRIVLGVTVGVMVVEVVGALLTGSLALLADAGTAPSFVVVATLVLGALFLGWRLVARVRRWTRPFTRR